MVGSLLLFIHLLVRPVFQAVPVSVSMDMDLPREVVAGSAFEVTITLKKGNLEGFSRFQQAYPEGLTATSVNSANADFTFTENRVRFIWLRLPRREEITFSYLVSVDQRLKGTFILNSQFSYVEDNETKIFEAEPVNITIVSSATIDPALTVDVEDFPKVTKPEARTADEINAITACIRQKPLPGPGGEYTVHLLVSKDNSSRFAKIEETIPSGYSAVVRDAQNGTFTYSSQMARFVWMVMPPGDHFMVSYTLVPSGRDILPAPRLTGTFTFLLGTETVSKGIPEQDADLSTLESYAIAQLVQQSSFEQAVEAPAASATASVTPAQGLPAGEAPSAREAPPAAVLPPAEEVPPAAVLPPAEEVPQPASSPLSAALGTGTPSETITQPPALAGDAQPPVEVSGAVASKANISFRVQVAAGRLPIDVTAYFGNLKLEGTVQRETENGLTRYTVGSFSNYQQAKEYKDQILKMTAIKDAFVVAYSNGNRINIQEALTATQ